MFVDDVAMTACTPPQLSIRHIEVTQATQDEGNTVPLIASKPTFVRVYLDCGEGCSAMPGVTGVLEVSGPAGGASLNPISQPVTAYHPASWTTQRGDLGKTLNFAVPNELMVAGEVTFTARAGGSSLSKTRTIQATNALRVAQIPIHYLACGYDTSPDVSAVTTVHSLAQNLLPVGGDTPIAIETWPKMYWSTPLKKDCSKPAAVDNINEENVILLLRTIEAQWFIHGGSNPPDYIFGWLPTGAFDRGVAWPKPSALYGVAAFSDVFANEDPLAEFTWSKVTFAHELGHLMGHNGIDTPDCDSDDPGTGWPWSDAKIHDWGVDSTYFGWSTSSTSVLKNPQTTFDYMSYCGWKSSTSPGWNLWTSASTYTTTLRLLAAGQADAVASRPSALFPDQWVGLRKRYGRSRSGLGDCADRDTCSASRRHGVLCRGSVRFGRCALESLLRPGFPALRNRQSHERRWFQSHDPLPARRGPHRPQKGRDRACRPLSQRARACRRCASPLTAARPGPPLARTQSLGPPTTSTAIH